MLQTDEIISYLRAHPKLAATEDYELCVQHATGRFWTFSGKTETGRGTDDNIWVGLRVLQRKQPGYSSGFARDRTALDEIVSRAVFASTVADPDPWFRFPVIRHSGQLSFPIQESSPPELPDDLPGSHVESSWYQWRSTGHLLRRLEKKEVSYPQYFERLVIRHNPNTGNGFEGTNEAVNAPVWVHARVMSQFLSLIGDWFCADRVHAGISPLAGKKKQRVFSDLISLVDNGDVSRGNQVPVDLEGVSTQKVELMERGELLAFLHSSRTAAMENRPSTGHYLRLPDEDAGRIRPLSLCIQPGDAEDQGPESLDEGYTLEFLEECRSTDSRSVVFRAMGRRIHAGLPGAWVVMQSAKCDLLEMLNRVEYVGKDLSLYGNFGSPSILLGNMPLSIKR